MLRCSWHRVAPYFFTLVSHFGVLLVKAFGKLIYFSTRRWR